MFSMCFLVLALSPSAAAVTVFSDSFASGGFANWSQSFMSAGATQTVSNGVARFVVPTPLAGSQTFSFVAKSGFVSTVNSTIIATQDIYVNKVPHGCAQGNGAIFFFYICDSTDLAGNNGNFGVGIDGSDVWSLWIGGNTTYTYVYQTAGAVPVSNTWYRIVLTVNNPAQTATLTVNGLNVINAFQQQLTDRTHPISLISGMGEDWWSDGSGEQGIDVSNVELYISDSSTAPTPTPETTPLPNSNQNGNSNPNPTGTQTTYPTATPKPHVTPNLTADPNPTAHPSESPSSMDSAMQIPLWLAFPLTVAAIAFSAAFALRLKNGKKNG